MRGTATTLAHGDTVAAYQRSRRATATRRGRATAGGGPGERLPGPHVRRWSREITDYRPLTPPGLWQEVGRSAAGPVHWPLCPAPLPPLVGGCGVANAWAEAPKMPAATSTAPATTRPMRFIMTQCPFLPIRILLARYAPFSEMQEAQNTPRSGLGAPPGERTCGGRPEGLAGPQRAAGIPCGPRRAATIEA
jgi:hypothetical protein